ncbi:MAG: leucine-rich repeat domain-containing protein [Spirochaetia bacterium]|nr:leucine-rich repeat domain-containing protein [Spirochaetia bacterium]
MKKFYLSLLTVICILCIIGCKHPQTPGNPQKPSDSATTGQDTGEPVKQEAEVRNENGTMVITKAGTISEEIFQNFIKNGTLTVAGPLTEENYELIAQLPITKLDLSGVTDIPGGYTQVTPSSEGEMHQNENVIPLDFYGNTALETVILPDTAEVLPAAEKIGYTAFSNCTKLQTLSLPKAEKLHNDILYNSSESQIGVTIQLPSSTTLESKVFNGFNTQNASLVLSGRPESGTTDKEWQGHTWKSISVK